MTRFEVYPRADCREGFAVVSPTGCVLPLRPLWENEAKHVVNTLNVFLEE